MTTITQVTPGQVKQNGRFLEDAFQTVRTELETMFDQLGSDNGQRFLENGDEFKADIRKAALESFGRLSVANQFADEEVRSNYGYLSGYKPKGLTEQGNILRQLFPGLGFVNLEFQSKIEKGEVKLSPKSQRDHESEPAWFAIPNWMNNPKIFGNSYNAALQVILDKIRETRNGKFNNCREGRLDSGHLQRSERTKKFFQELSDTQGNPDILIVPAQFGFRHRGRSVRRAHEVFLVNEFGLGTFAVGIMILTHPERLQNIGDLWIDASGDEYSPDADGQFGSAPYFYFNGGMVRFGTFWIGIVYGHYGTASGFLPQ